MNNFVKILIFSLFAITTFAQQATEIDSKSVKLPRYASQAAVTAAIPTPTKGMLIYRNDTNSNWYYNGTSWVNSNNTNGLSLPYSNSSSDLNSTFEIINSSESNNPESTEPSENVAIKGVYNGYVNPGYEGHFDRMAGVYGLFNGTGNSYSSIIGGAGVLGEGYNGASGVVGYSFVSNSSGVHGSNQSNGNGVYGFSLSGRGGDFEAYGTGIGVRAICSSGTGGYFSSPHGNALVIDGPIRVVGISRAAFKVVTGPFISGNKSGIPNTTSANTSTDILIVTYQYTGGSYLNKQFATFWNGGNWEIHLTDGSAMPVGITFNILVIKQ